MRVRSLPRNDTSCGWIQTLGERPPATPLTGEVEADWAIIGAGYTGVAAARRLAALRPEARVVVVDAQRSGECSSGRNSGFAVDLSTSAMGAHPAGDPVTLRRRRLNLAGIEMLERVVERHGIDCQWSKVGKLHCAAEEQNFAELDDIVSVCRRLDLPFQDLDRATLATRLGTDYYLRGVHTPLAVMLQPAALARGLATTLPDSVTVYEQSPVTRIEYGARVRLTCPGGHLEAPNVILAANAFLPSLGVLRRRLAPMTLTASMTRPLTPAERATIGDPQDWGVLSAHAMGATVRYTRDHRIAMRNTSEFRARLWMSPTELAERRRVHERGIRSRFPMLPDLSIDYTWSGLTCMSRNLTPFFGRLERNVYASGGYNGSGVARGTAAGSLLVDYALGEDSDLLSDILSLPGPSWIPPRPFLDLGLSWRLARARAGAGRER